jgi:Mg-chelatase subunit ChlD
MVVSFAGQARVVQPFTGDPSLLRDAVRGIGATDQAGRLDAALRLVEPFAMQAAEDTERDLIVYVLSDGRVPPHAEGVGELALPDADLRFVQVAQRPADAANVGVVSFSARRDFERPQWCRCSRGSATTAQPR